MTAAEFRAWRLRIDCTQAQAAEAIGVSRRLVVDYESGARPITRTVRAACQWVEHEIKGDKA